MNEEQRLARRLSGALGRKIDPAEIEDAGDDYVRWGDRLVPLLRGNVAFVDGAWHRNGRCLTEAEADRLLPPRV
jgi:hypothetical protein